MNEQILTSWGRVLQSKQAVFQPQHRFATLPSLLREGQSWLPYGNGRSYGDSCLNEGGAAIKSKGLRRFMAFDTSTGVLSCEAGVLLDDILRLIVPHGWFLQVTPGTRFVTVGGAIANDVHGKNHHVDGTFGCHLRQFELLRSDHQRLLCSPIEHVDLFSATIGGLGLTGLIVWAEIQLRHISSPWIRVESIPYRCLDEFFELCRQSDHEYEYTVAWVDCTKRGAQLGRGVFFRGNHASNMIDAPRYQVKSITFPIAPTFSLVNAQSMKLFNLFYYYQHKCSTPHHIQHYQPFFYPLDSILEWNKMYGVKGFYQYQCVIPLVAAKPVLTELLSQIACSGLGSFLAVLKVCGDVKSPGLLSFPLEGVSLALDFPVSGDKLQPLLSRLDAIISPVGGRLYPAKDGRMTGKLFRDGYPRWQDFSRFIDPGFSSSFWRRVMGDL